MNNTLFNFLFSLSHYPSVAAASLFISNVLIYILIAAALLAPLMLRRGFRSVFLVGATGAGAWLCAFIIKNLFQIPRPFIAFDFTPLFLESGFSFPSSHATVFAALTVLMWNLNRRLGVVFMFFTLLICVSRTIIGVHYPFDVMTGAALGVLLGLGALRLYRAFTQVAFFNKSL